MSSKECQTGWWQDIGVLLKGGWFSKWKENRHLCTTELWNQIATAYAVCFILAAFSAAITQQVLLSVTLPLLVTTIFLLPDFWSLSVRPSSDSDDSHDNSSTYNIKYVDRLSDNPRDDLGNLFHHLRDEARDRGYDGGWNIGNGTYRSSSYTGGGAVKRMPATGSGTASPPSGSGSPPSGSGSPPSGSGSAGFKNYINDDSYNQRAKRPEGFVDSPPGASSGTEIGYLEPALTLPSAKNPFMNVSPDEVKYNPFRPPAADVDDPSVKKYLDKFFRVQWFSDPTDVFGKSQNQRQFITQPSTSIPNDRKSYQDWLYKLPFKTCKEGGRDVCIPGSSGGFLPSLQVNNY